MKHFLLVSVTLTLISAQNSLRPGSYKHNTAGDTGEPYIHDTTGDHGPYYYWKLRKQAEKEAARSSGPVAVETVPEAAPVQPTPAPVQAPAPAPARFANFQAIPARAVPATPARQQQRIRVPAQRPRQQ